LGLRRVCITTDHEKMKMKKMATCSEKKKAAFLLTR